MSDQRGPYGHGTKAPAPDHAKLTDRQAQRLAKLTDVDPERMKGHTIAHLRDELRWIIDPELLLFRRVCGRVVKTDPATGVDRPVPMATVHIEDTDCSFLGLFPSESPWAWLFPGYCHREEIGWTKTDHCGRFCAWIPWFEIDWVRRWRLERRCYVELGRPTLRDILTKILTEPDLHHPPGPQPNGDPVIRPGAPVHAILEHLLGRDRAHELVGASAAFGGSTRPTRDLLAQRAFKTPLSPPLPEHVLAGLRRAASDPEVDREALGASLHSALTSSAPGIEGRLKFNVDRFIGPLLRCDYEFETEIVPLLDVPDITFRVTQDVDGDGDEEVVYDEGFFDVRWNA